MRHVALQFPIGQVVTPVLAELEAGPAAHCALSPTEIAQRNANYGA